MLTLLRDMRRNRALARYLSAKRKYCKARERFSRAERALRDSKDVDDDLHAADKVVRDFALALAQGRAVQLLAARAACDSLRDAPPAPRLAPSEPVTLKEET